ncbi:uncharacterized protein LOC119689956 [Teleopsis dalmanni]|uniref:uncharacterized protein LOC119689956 n=1 Tax=Teleopsis dalmanni TaxID=139649 RepID=UPI0018CE5C5A|nr:uncharacterized protein LOC119689956 [Teleopsis dalmanni]
MKKLMRMKKYGEKLKVIRVRLHMSHDTTLQLCTRCLNAYDSKTIWTIEDDIKLVDFVLEHETSNWLQFTEIIGNHIRTSCCTCIMTIEKYAAKNKNAMLKDVPRHKVLERGNLVETKQSSKLKYQSVKP